MGSAYLVPPTHRWSRFPLVVAVGAASARIHYLQYTASYRCNRGYEDRGVASAGVEEGAMHCGQPVLNY
jgi:hypothetical protein